jgi:O-6-methylguanine DNA methyltransferase
MKRQSASAGWTLFDTPLGSCGIAWDERGILALKLPEDDEVRTAEALLGKALASKAPPPPGIRKAIDALVATLNGEDRDLSTLPLVLDDLPPFHRKVYEAARRVRRGEVTTYGELAALAGSPGASRAVGQAMARNRFPLVVPCHRVLAAGGKAGGFTAGGGVATKARLLALEGRTLQPQGSLFHGDEALPFDRDEAVRFLSAAEAKLGALIERVGPLGLSLQSMHSPYEALASAIVYQQLSGKAAATIFRRACESFGRTTWPAPAALLAATDDQLRGAGVSRPKIAALRDLAAKAQDGTVPPLAKLRAMGDDAIIDRLTTIRGIGRWTVEMLLMFRLGRPDVLPLADLGLRKGFGRLFLRGEVASADQLARRGERWRPFRTAASWYLWRAAEQP